MLYIWLWLYLADNTTDNASQSLADSNATQSPSLWLAAFDPKLGLRKALETGYTRMILISANGDTAVNVGLIYRQANGAAPAYDYGKLCFELYLYIVSPREF